MLWILVAAFLPVSGNAFAPATSKMMIRSTGTAVGSGNTRLFMGDEKKGDNDGGMKRPILDQLATTLFRLEQDRVEKSSVEDEQGRVGEPMEWSEADSWSNKLSQVMASGPGYAFKQFVADIVAGSDYDEASVRTKIQSFVQEEKVVMFSFTSCPFCRRAKDLLDEQGISYRSMELDELPGNEGNEIRAVLGKLTKRTSVPSIFIDGNYIGGCNDGNPGLVPLIETGELDKLMTA
eukprot:scaffold69347_cov44-Attheya_sp.AAC.2